MKTFFYLFIALFLCMGCTEEKNAETFINKTTGRYLFNANEVITIYFEDQILYASWRGKEKIKPIKINENSFYMAEMNEKLVFLDNPSRIELAEKKEHKGEKYVFKKLGKFEKTPGEYLAENDFDGALAAYLNIKEKDSLNPVIQERRLNQMGYEFKREKELDKAIQILTINTILYPNKSNTFDSLGNAYWLKKDTVNAVLNYKKALEINPEKRSALAFLKRHKLE